MINRTRPRMLRIGLAVVAATLLAAPVSVGTSSKASADGYQRISGEGSSWAANAIDAMRVNVRQFGITVDYNPSGSTSGRKNFLNGTVDFAASDIPFQFHPEDGSAPENPAPGSYAYIPVVAGGTAFMYNLKINGKRVTNLRLSGENVAKIFTRTITKWDDPAIQADNPGLTMPARDIVPVVRSDGSGSSAQFTKWMIATQAGVWNEYCQRSGRAPACGFTSFYPTVKGIVAQSGDLGIAGYVSQGFAEGAIGYVNYSYALGAQFPVVKVLNKAGYYTEPNPQNVAVSLLKAKINMNEADPAVYLTQVLDGVYSDTDPRSYQLSSYSYFILPTKVAGQFNEAKGRTLGAVAYYMMCQAQQQSASLGYSPMPINLVQASLEQIAKIPGVEVQSVDITKCNNPTFSSDGTNVLAKKAPQPKACDKKGPNQCPYGTGGLQNVQTPVNASASGGTSSGGSSSGSGGSSSGSGGSSSGGTASGGTTDGAGSDGTGTTPGGQQVDGTGSGSDTGTGTDGGTVGTDTGAGVSDGTGSASAAEAVPVGDITTTTLDRQSAGLGLGMLVTVLLLTLVVVPAFVWRRLSGGRSL